MVFNLKWSSLALAIIYVLITHLNNPVSISFTKHAEYANISSKQREKYF